MIINDGRDARGGGIGACAGCAGGGRGVDAREVRKDTGARHGIHSNVHYIYKHRIRSARDEEPRSARDNNVFFFLRGT